MVAPPPLCPELKFRLATDVTALWEATEEWTGRTGLPPPYWAFCWPGGQAIARFLMDDPGLVEDRFILDFGAGTGIGAIAAAKAGARRVVACDRDPFSIEAMRLNAGLNDVELEITDDDLIGEDEGWDVVILGDVCYERSLAERVIPWINALFTRGARVLLADPGRAYLPRNGLRKIATYVVPTPLDLEDRKQRETILFEPLETLRLPTTDDTRLNTHPGNR